MVGSALFHITGEVIPVRSRIMLLLSFDYFKLQDHKLFFANLLKAVSLLLAKGWKMEEPPTLEEWFSKARHMCLVSKLSALYRQIQG